MASPLLRDCRCHRKTGWFNGVPTSRRRWRMELCLINGTRRCCSWGRAEAQLMHMRSGSKKINFIMKKLWKILQVRDFSNHTNWHLWIPRSSYIRSKVKSWGNTIVEGMKMMKIMGIGWCRESDHISLSTDKKQICMKPRNSSLSCYEFTDDDIRIMNITLHTVRGEDKYSQVLSVRMWWLPRGGTWHLDSW